VYVVIPADVKAWTKTGEPQVLAKSFGAYLHLQKFCDPDGHESDFSLFGGKNWAIICPVTKSGDLILVRQYKQGVDKIVIEFPAGTASDGEGLEATASRELLEETGFHAERVISLSGPHHISTRKSPTFSGRL